MKRLVLTAVLLAGCRPSDAGVAVNKGDFEGYTGSAKATERLPLLVVMHGFGGTPDRIAEVVQGLRLKARVFAPHGIYAHGSGWSWWNERGSWDDQARSIDAAAAVVERKIAAEVAAQPTCGKPVVLGFSQGGILSYAIAARIPDKIAAAIPLGGTLPRPLWPKSAPKVPIRVTAFHGEIDDVVAPTVDKETHAGFVATGYRGELHLIPEVKHRLPPEVIVAVREQIEREIRDEGCVVP